MTSQTLTEDTTPAVLPTSPPTVQELDLAWAAVRAGRFRADALTGQA